VAMEGPQVSSSSTILTDGQECIVKQEKPDSDRRSDKVLQFALALQRCAEKGPITINANTPNDEPPRPRRGPITIQYVDLTLSDDDDEAEESSISQSTISHSPAKPSTDAQTQSIGREEEVQHGSALNGNPTMPPPGESVQEPSATVNSTTAEEEEMAYDLAMSALEVSMEETENGHGGMEPRFKHRKFSKSQWGHGLTLQYTHDQKRIALEGNPAFDYRTRLGENGEEKYAIYKCPKCPTGFPRMHHYLVHMKGHGGNPNLKFPCRECDYRTMNSNFLANHMDRHRLQREPHIFGKEGSI